MLKKEEINDKNKEEYKGGKLSEVVIASLRPFLEKLSSQGIKGTLNGYFPDLNLEKLVLRKIKNQLSKHRVIELGNAYLDKIEIQYRHEGIQIEPCGILRLLVKKITITDTQIIRSFESIISQIEEKYIKDNKYIISKIDEIIANLSRTGIYKPKNSEEKTFCDLAMLILVNYYKATKITMPSWINKAVKNIGKGEFLGSWIDILIDYTSEVIANVSENIFVNFKVTFDSLMVRMILDKKTNKGQISSLLKMMNINVKEIIYSFAKSYISPSFTKGTAEILSDVASLMLSTVDKNLSHDSERKISDLPFNITVSMGENFASDRAFMWYTSANSKENFIEYSYDENFGESTEIKAESKLVSKTFPFVNLGLVAGYNPIKLMKHTLVLKNLSPGTIYYKIKTENGKETETYKLKIREETTPCEVLIFADSQGMIKQDYEIFSDVMDKAFENSDPDFMVHLGDFVDNGNNEEYWTWILDSRHWKENICLPLAGNHESIKSATTIKENVQNGIIGHFNVQGLQPQDTSRGIYYSFEYKNATFVVLNTNFSETGIDDIQYRYALDTLRKSKSKWKIILTHKCPYSNGPHALDSDVKKIGKQIKKLAYQGGADVVFGGHDHVYVRTKILSLGKNVFCEEFSKKENEFTNPFGTIFVIPGTSGVKNYSQNLKISIPAEKILSPPGQVYSKLTFSDSKLKFKAYLIDEKTKETKIIDSFCIKKVDKNPKKIDSKYVSKLINSIPDNPCIDDTEKINEILERYNGLAYHEKIKVKNSDYLSKMIKLKKNYSEITSGQICRVSTKKEFLSAVKNKNIGTIITCCDEIKFGENPFINKTIEITRPLCIRGSAKLSHINFILKEKSMLILCDNVCIDNTRKTEFFNKNKDIIKMLDNSCLMLSDNASINSFSGIKSKTTAIKISGEDCAVYLETSGVNFVKGKFLEALNPNSKIKVSSGKYLSAGDTFIINCNLTVKGGFIRNIKGFENSITEIFGGIIGDENNPQYVAPIESQGKLVLESGIIRKKDEISIIMQGSKEITKKKGDLSNPIDIKGKILYN